MVFSAEHLMTGSILLYSYLSKCSFLHFKLNICFVTQHFDSSPLTEIRHFRQLSQLTQYNWIVHNNELLMVIFIATLVPSTRLVR